MLGVEGQAANGATVWLKGVHPILTLGGLLGIHMTGFIFHVRLSQFFFFFAEEGGSGANRTQSFPVKEKYLMLYSLLSQCCTFLCFRHQGSWDRRPFGPYFRSQLGILQCSKRQGSYLLQVSNTHAPYSSKFYSDVLHEGITHDCGGPFLKGRSPERTHLLERRQNLGSKTVNAFAAHTKPLYKH